MALENVIKVTENVYWLGMNDRRTHLFENLWPIENGVAYNAYLIDDEKVALIDTVEISKADEFIEKIKSVLGNRQLDYLIINHMEPDHSGALKDIVRQYPDIKFVGNKRTFAMLDSFYQITSNIIEIENGTTLDLGKHKLKFYLTPWVHWPETMMTYELTNGILFSADAFGSFGTLDGGIFDDEINLNFYWDEMLRYYSNIVGKYSNMVQKALTKLADVNVKIIAPTHGIVWRKDIGKILAAYNDWSSFKTECGAVIVYGTMYGNTAKMADTIARQLSENGIRNIRVYDASKTHRSYIIRDIWKYKALILGSCAYNSTLFPTVAALVNEIGHMDIKEHLFGIFGSYSWNGGGVKTLVEAAEKHAWELVHEPIETKGAAKEESFENCKKLASNMAKRLKEQFEK